MEHLKSTEFVFGTSARGARKRQNYPKSLQKPHRARRLGHLSDFHVGKPTYDDLDELDAVRRWLEAFERAQVDVLAVTGDLVERPGDRACLRRVEQLLERASFPYLTIPGNHDVPHPGQPGAFEDIFGEYPAIQRHRDVDFVLFDSMKGLPELERSELERIDALDSGCFSRGRVGGEQRRKLEAMLDKTPPEYGRVMLVHHHLRYNAPTGEGWQREPTAPHGLMAPLDDAARQLDWAAEHRCRLALHGHKHKFWDAYQPRPDLIVLNSGTSVQAKPDRPRRGRSIDIWPGAKSIVVHDLELEA